MSIFAGSYHQCLRPATMNLLNGLHSAAISKPCRTTAFWKPVISLARCRPRELEWFLAQVPKELFAKSDVAAAVEEAARRENAQKHSTYYSNTTCHITTAQYECGRRAYHRPFVQTCALPSNRKEAVLKAVLTVKFCFRTRHREFATMAVSE
ncbi:hypothetical protein Pelo_4324 [Pelomyxa schiedti]|nr:hypothetical protein Pelo_4324 [Pelomyxa schiedti]